LGGYPRIDPSRDRRILAFLGVPASDASPAIQIADPMEGRSPSTSPSTGQSGSAGVVMRLDGNWLWLKKRYYDGALG